LPLEAPLVAAGLGATESGRRRALGILVVEDNRDSAESLRDLLSLDAHEVAVALDGPTGLAAAHEFVPDVVLCDIGLPGMDGYQVARALRAEPSLRRAFLVALTGYALPDDVRSAMDAGFDRHLAKPPDRRALVEALDAASARAEVPAGGLDGGR
jgi:two-component system CheB/CheR fusion protein